LEMRGTFVRDGFWFGRLGFAEHGPLDATGLHPGVKSPVYSLLHETSVW
jgi:hypothetical protein